MDIGSPYHRDCVVVLKAEHAKDGVEIDVFMHPPRPRSLHLTEWVCPHNVRYYHQPSRMQIQRWRRAATVSPHPSG